MSRLRGLLPHSPQIVSKKQIVDQVKIMPVFLFPQRPTRSIWTNLTLLWCRPSSISRPWLRLWPSHSTPRALALNKLSHSLPKSVALERPRPSLPGALALFSAPSSSAISSLVALLCLVVWPNDLAPQHLSLWEMSSFKTNHP